MLFLAECQQKCNELTRGTTAKALSVALGFAMSVYDAITTGPVRRGCFVRVGGRVCVHRRLRGHHRGRGPVWVESVESRWFCPCGELSTVVSVFPQTVTCRSVGAASDGLKSEPVESVRKEVSPRWRSSSLAVVFATRWNIERNWSGERDLFSERGPYSRNRCPRADPPFRGQVRTRHAGHRRGWHHDGSSRDSD